MNNIFKEPEEKGFNEIFGSNERRTGSGSLLLTAVAIVFVGVVISAGIWKYNQPQPIPWCEVPIQWCEIPN